MEHSAPPRPGPVRPFRFPRFERRRLGGGLDLLAAPVRRTPLVHLILVAPRGAGSHSGRRAGLAALTASLLDEGTRRYDSRRLARAVERLGGYLSTSADWDATRISMHLLAEHLDAGLELLAEVATAPTFPEGEVERLRGRTLAEIRRRSAFPAVLTGQELARRLYGGSPYGAPLLGTERSVTALGRPAVVRFYERHVATRGATLVAVGDLDPDRLAGSAAAALAGFARAAAPEPLAIAPSEPAAVRVIVLDRPHAAQTELRLGHAGPPRTHPDHPSIVVLNSILGGKFISRLNLNLRERRGLTYGVSSQFAGRRGPGPFVVAAAVATESAGAAVRESIAELRRLRERLVEREEIDDAREYLLGVFPYTVQSLDGIGRRLEDLVVFALADDYYERLPDELRRVDRRQVREAARRHLHPERLTIVAVGPAERLRAQLAPFGHLRIRRG